MKVAVVGHVEACAFATVDHVPVAGEIVEAAKGWEQAAGGGAVAAVQLARLAGECLFLTAIADDRFGRAAKRDLEALGLRVEAAWRPATQRRAFVHLDATGERTITVTGDRLAPAIADPLPWAELESCDAVYFTAGDRGAAVAARKATRMVATIRAKEGLSGSGVELDVLVASAGDRGERYVSGAIEPLPRAAVLTAGVEGGLTENADGARDSLGRSASAGPGRRRLRRRRLVRRRLDLRAGAGPSARAGGRARGEVRGRVRHRPGTV